VAAVRAEDCAGVRVAHTGVLKRFHLKFDIDQIVEQLEADKPVL
jgi:hypothetical protein